MTVEYINGFLGVPHFRQFNKGKSAGSSGIQVANDLHRLDFETVLFDPGLKLVFGCQMRKITDIKPCHLCVPLLSFGRNCGTIKKAWGTDSN